MVWYISNVGDGGSDGEIVGESGTTMGSEDSGDLGAVGSLPTSK